LVCLIMMLPLMNEGFIMRLYGYAGSTWSIWRLRFESKEDAYKELNGLLLELIGQ